MADAPVVGFDHHSPEFHAHRHVHWAALRQRCPVAHNPRYGGSPPWSSSSWTTAGHLTDDELLALLWNLVGGGLDTTTSLTSLSLYHLDGHPELRRRLAGEPDLLATATRVGPAERPF